MQQGRLGKDTAARERGKSLIKEFVSQVLEGEIDRSVVACADGFDLQHAWPAGLQRLAVLGDGEAEAAGRLLCFRGGL